MKSKRKPVLIAAILLALVFVGAVCFFILPKLLNDPTKPPALLTSEELGEMKLLFDGETTNGWKIEGPSRIQDGTLELGGEQATMARLEREFNPGDKLQFHFFHERSPGMSMPDDAVMKMELVYVNPDDLHKGQQGPPNVELRKSGLTPQGGANRWHKGTVTTESVGDVPINFKWNVRLYQYLTKDFGPSISGSRSSDDGCRFVILFQTASGNKLFLRNLCVEERN